MRISQQVSFILMFNSVTYVFNTFICILEMYFKERQVRNVHLCKHPFKEIRICRHCLTEYNEMKCQQTDSILKRCMFCVPNHST